MVSNLRSLDGPCPSQSPPSDSCPLPISISLKSCPFFLWDICQTRLPSSHPMLQPQIDQGPDRAGAVVPTRHEGAGGAGWQELSELGAQKRLRREGQRTRGPAAPSSGSAGGLIWRGRPSVPRAGLEGPVGRPAHLSPAGGPFLLVWPGPGRPPSRDHVTTASSSAAAGHRTSKLRESPPAC